MNMRSSFKPILWRDNLSANALEVNPVFQARTKHIEIDVHFVCDQVHKGAVEIRYVTTTNQLANCFTKPLSHSHLFCFHDKFEVVELPPRLRGDIRENV